ncbi:zinc finger protein 585A [Anabrus simplex]|uniref:zinc finger protein 585A n=1 Tax=Anabrus simplex TaxID=316456 RepID=UPI0035A2E3CD
MGRRTEKTKKVRRQRWTHHGRSNSQGVRVSCFVCDEEIVGKGVPLLISHTSHSKTGLPAKIGELMGDGFMVVVSVEDTLCKRCSALINHLDKLEADLFLVKKALTDYLKVKYQLTDEDLAGQQAVQFEEEDPEQLSHVSANIDANCYTSEDINVEDDNEEPSYQYEYEEHKTESEESGCENNGTAKRVDEMIFGDSSSERMQNLIQEKLHKCSSCGYETSDGKEFGQHRAEQCDNLQHKCSICGKTFESNKNIQNHIMQAHLSKWTCYFCHVTFSDETEYTSHVKSHLDSSLYSPQVKLEPVQSDGSESSDHCEPPKNLLGNYECNICDFQTDNKLLFEDHLRQHVVLKLFKCNICGLRFEDEESLTKHEEEHQKETFKCDACSLSFLNRQDLAVHSESHYEKIVCDVKTVSLSEWDMTRDEDFLDQSDISVDDSDIGKRVNVEEKSTDVSGKSHDADDKSFQFHTCSSCSLTFVNDELFKEHMKSHNIIVQDIVKHENSVISSLVEPNDYVESVMDDSLEDIFAKMNSQSEASYEAQSKEVLSQGQSFKCGICSEEFREAEKLEAHKSKHASCNTDTLPSQSSEKDSSCDLLVSQGPGIGTQQISENVLSEENKLIKISSFLKPDISSSNIYDEEEDSLENIYKMVCEKKLSSIDAANSLMLDSEGFLKLKAEEFEFTPKEQIESPPLVINNNEITEEKVIVKKKYVCAICGFKSSSMIELKRHFKYHREVGQVNCKLCKQVFPSHLKLKQHMKCHHELPPILPLPEKLLCPICLIEYPDKSNLLQHLKEHHPREKTVYQCHFCEMLFSSRKAWKVHEESHPERFTYSCDECNQSFLKEKQLSDHKDLQHRDPHCKYCGKEILKLKTLRNHELRHQKEKDNYECDICKRVFKTKTGLRHHVAVHTGEYKYCCDYCGRGFMSRMMMEEHRSMHTKEERYVCDVCGRKFSFQSTYWIHRKWHDNPYPYKCSFCGRMFRHSSLLAVHKRKHTGERPYKCPHCPLTFPVGGTLKRHLILHTGVYPFNCDTCKRGFTTRHKYATHLAKTHGDFDLLNARPQQNDFKMVIRDDAGPQAEQEPTAVWQFAEDSEQGEMMNFKLAVAAAAGNDGLDSLESGIPCSIVSEDLLSDSIMPTRVVEIVLDEASQAVATVTLADPTAGLLPELWYQ